MFFLDDEQDRDGFELAPARPRKGKRSKHIERLTFVKSSLLHQINVVSMGQPSARVALISFSGEVSMYTGSQVVALPEAIFHDPDQIVAFGSKHAAGLLPLESQLEKLSTQIRSLSPSGPTAFGPALALAIGLASTTTLARVIVCIDGAPNVGFGAIEELSDTSAGMMQAFQHYCRLGSLASQHSAVVNIIAIQGSECQLDVLSSLPFTTGGKSVSCPVDDVDEQIEVCLNQRVLAVEGLVKLHHPSILSANVDSLPYHRVTSNREIPLGVVTCNTFFACSFGLLLPASQRASPPAKVPLQVEVTSRDPRSGHVLVTVLMAVHLLESDPTRQERLINPLAVAYYATTISTSLGLVGRYSEARLRMMSHKSQLERICGEDAAQRANLMNSFAFKLDKLQYVLGTEQRNEQSKGVFYLIDQMGELEPKPATRQNRRARDSVISALSEIRASIIYLV